MITRRTFLGYSLSSLAEKYLPKSKNLIYTFDDVPFNKKGMINFVEILKQNNCKSQFYLTGKGIKEIPDSVEYLIDQGYSVGWHSMNHDVMSYKNDKEFLKDIIQWKSLLKEVSPNYEPKYARFPYGLGKNSQIKILNEEGLNMQKCVTNIKKTRNWDVDSIDWHPYLVRSAKDVKRRISKFHSNNPIILLFHLTLAKPLNFGSRKVSESLITSDPDKFQKYC